MSPSNPLRLAPGALALESLSHPGFIRPTQFGYICISRFDARFGHISFINDYYFLTGNNSAKAVVFYQTQLP